MPRFYFHLHNDIDAPDEEGKEFADLAAARAYALFQVRHVVGETAKETGRIVLSHRIDIEDDQEQVLDTVRFDDGVEIEP
jgi:hypothetical protein